MARRPRYDTPDSIHHVFSRGLCHRTMFEKGKEIRLFLARLVREHRRGRIHILAYSFLTNHYHLVLRSRKGELSKAMQNVLRPYVRRFNRPRRRDGSLARGRFESRVVRSKRYFRLLVRYVDLNAPDARLSKTPQAYLYGSARHYEAARRPLWLHTEEVDAWLGNPDLAERAASYRKVFGFPLRASDRSIIETNLTRAPSVAADLDSLVEAAPPVVREWMRRQAHLADNTKPGIAYADAGPILECLRVEQRTGGALHALSPGGRAIDPWPVLAVGLLRDLGGLTLTEVGTRVDQSHSWVRRRLAEHRHLILTNEPYALLAARVARCALDAQWGKS